MDCNCEGWEFNESQCLRRAAIGSLPSKAAKSDLPQKIGNFATKCPKRISISVDCHFDCAAEWKVPQNPTIQHYQKTLSSHLGWLNNTEVSIL
jgi:hypothetical protein